MSNLPAHWCAEAELHVPFHDVDLMGIVWHGHYVKYFEIARCRLFDQIEYNYAQMKESGYTWPIVDMHVRYVAPCVFRQNIVVLARIAEYEYRLKINYEIRDKESGQCLTKGHTVQVAVDIDRNEMCLGSPRVLYERLGLESDA